MFVCSIFNDIVPTMEVTVEWDKRLYSSLLLLGTTYRRLLSVAALSPQIRWSWPQLPSTKSKGGRSCSLVKLLLAIQLWLLMTLPHLASCLGATPVGKHETITGPLSGPWLQQRQSTKPQQLFNILTHSLYSSSSIYILLHLNKRLCIVLCPPLWSRNMNKHVFTARGLVSISSEQRALPINISASVWCHVTFSASWLAVGGKYRCKVPSYLLIGLTSPLIKQRKN
jgi:hypothetical protein